MEEWARVGGAAVQKIAEQLPEKQLLATARTLTKVGEFVAATKE